MKQHGRTASFRRPPIHHSAVTGFGRVALLGGPTGLEIYGRLIADAARVLRRRGWLLLELGYKFVRPGASKAGTRVE